MKLVGSYICVSVKHTTFLTQCTSFVFLLLLFFRRFFAHFYQCRKQKQFTTTCNEMYHLPVFWVQDVCYDAQSQSIEDRNQISTFNKKLNTMWCVILRFQIYKIIISQGHDSKQVCHNGFQCIKFKVTFFVLKRQNFQMSNK